MHVGLEAAAGDDARQLGARAGAPRASCPTTTKPITTHRHHHQPAASTGACGRHSCSATHLQHAADVRRAHDQQMQQRGGRRRSGTQHGRVHEPAQPPARAARATRPTAAIARISLMLSYLILLPCHRPPTGSKGAVRDYRAKCCHLTHHLRNLTDPPRNTGLARACAI